MGSRSQLRELDAPGRSLNLRLRSHGSSVALPACVGRVGRAALPPSPRESPREGGDEICSRKVTCREVTQRKPPCPAVTGAVELKYCEARRCEIHLMVCDSVSWSKNVRCDFQSLLLLQQRVLRQLRLWRAGAAAPLKIFIFKAVRFCSCF